MQWPQKYPVNWTSPGVKNAILKEEVTREWEKYIRAKTQAKNTP